MLEYTLPFGRGALAFHLLPGMQGEEVHAKRVPAVSDPVVAIEEAMANPLGTPRLGALAQRGMKVTILFTDATRASPDHLLVRPLLRALEAAGVRDEDIRLLCAVGLHRPSSLEEKEAKVGRDVVARYAVFDHNAQAHDLVNLGVDDEGVPYWLNRMAYESDLLLGIGIVEPHQYAGYSGGGKIASIGVAGEPTIAMTHGPGMLGRSGVRLGRLSGNPFQRAVREGARRARLRFVLNVATNESGEILAVRAGDPIAVQDVLAKIAAAVYEVPVLHRYDLIVGGVGWPKDVNLYQASRAASYLYFSPSPVLRPHGFLIIPAPCPEGAGEGVGEQRFLAAMRSGKTPQEVKARLERVGYPPGAQRAYIMAQVLAGARVVIVGAQDPDVVRMCHMTPTATMGEALALVQAELGKSLQVLVVPHAMLTLPRLAEEADT